MSNIVCTDNRILPMTTAAIEKVRRFEEILRELPQVKIETHHVLHAGIYSRTVKLPAGTTVTGVLIKIPTTIVVSGQCVFYIDEDVVEVNGHQVFAASGYRKQACHALADTTWTMSFRTDAKTIEECEQQFTDESEQLASRSADAVNIINITGE